MFLRNIPTVPYFPQADEVTHLSNQLDDVAALFRQSRVENFVPDYAFAGAGGAGGRLVTDWSQSGKNFMKAIKSDFTTHMDELSDLSRGADKLDDVVKGTGVDTFDDWIKNMSPKDAAKYTQLQDLKQAGFSAEELYNLEKFGSIKTQLDYTTSTGLRIQGTEGKTTTILGTYKNDTGAIVDELGNIKSTDFGAKNGGLNVLNTPDELYTTPKQFWNDYNQPWLDEVINRGDVVKMATEPTYNNLTRVDAITGKVELSGFGKEYSYLKQAGYVYDPITKSMIKP